MSKAGKFLGTLIVVIIVLVGALAIAASTVDINKYRPQLADALSKQIGRTVKLDGPIKFDITKHGVGLAAEDASVGNPAWASRPQMARIGKLELGVALQPLLHRQLVVNELNVDSADIQLETNAAGQHNWDLNQAVPNEPASPQAQQPSSAPGGNGVGIQVNEVSIADSKLVMRDKDGNVSIFAVDELTLTPAQSGATLVLEGDYDGAPIKLNLKTGASDLIASSKWPYDAEASYANYQLKAKGDVDRDGKAVTLDSYELSAGSSTLHGQLTLNYGGKTDLSGTIDSDRLDTADFKLPASGSEKTTSEETSAPAPESANGATPLFSRTPLDLAALKSADATIDVSVGELTLGKSSLTQVSGKLTLANGDLAISPFKATLGQSELQGSVKLAAASAPAQYTLSFKAPGVDLAGLLDMLGTKPFLTGKGDADIQLSGSGSSLHEMAASTNGHIDITAQGGAINAAAAGSVASGLAQILAPGASAPTLNCIAARFNLANGVAKDNGILADSSASTVAGSGGFNLGEETVDMTLDAKPKNVNTRGLTPALKITGALGSPNFGIDTVGTVQNAASTLLKGKLGNLAGGGTSAEAGVPALQSAPQGQNACVYTLDHKSAAAASGSQNSAVKNTSGAPAGNLKKTGSQLLKGLLGH